MDQHIRRMGAGEFCDPCPAVEPVPGTPRDVILAIVMRPEPVLAFRSEEEAEFYNTYGGSRLSALQRMQSIMKRLETRVQRLEDAVTDPEKDWDRRFRNI